MFTRIALCLTRGLGLFLACSAAQTQVKTVSCVPSQSFIFINQLLGQKHYEEAAKILDELITCPQLSRLENFEIGWLYGRARHFDTALRVIERVPATFPDLLTHAYAVALSEFELSNFRGAIDTLEAVRSAGAFDSKAANLLAVSYSKLTLYNQAHGILLEQLKREPNDLTTYLNLVTISAEGGDLPQAAQVATDAVERFPGSAEVLIVRGAANSLLGRPEQATQDFTTAAKLAPERADARFFIALMNYDRAQYLQAITVLKQAEQDGLEDADLHYLMAESFLKAQTGNIDEALEQVNRALQLNSNSIPARTLRGRLLLEEGKPEQALVDLEAAHRADPGSRSTLYNLARAYRAAGKTAESTALFVQLRSDKPDILKETGDRRLSGAFFDTGQP